MPGTAGGYALLKKTFFLREQRHVKGSIHLAFNVIGFITRKGKENFMFKTKHGEMTKIIRGMEALGYQVDSIQMLPEGGFYAGCRVTVKASLLSEKELPEKAASNKHTP